jgi:mannose-6-phosphate isomerase-like protein (cupin superfamily)
VIAGECKTNVDLAGAGEHFAVRAIDGPATMVWMCGDWAGETASGIFAVDGADGREDRGDAVNYPKETSFDCHYHDCDEYWILFSGCGVAVSEGRHYEVEPGDCVATGMGFHHDFPRVYEAVRAVYFETELEGEHRKGHLWEHTHGAAVPRAERV